MFETHVTIVGNVVTPVDRRRFADGRVVANFRVGSTERRYDRATGGWVDGERLYVEVNCWRFLADNAAASLVKGDPVVVTGKLYTRDYEHEGQRRTAVTVEALSVAADLAHCTAVLTRTRRGAPSAATEAPAARPDSTTATDVEHASEGDAASRLVGAAPAGQG
jgi:single-strand DNA-binding protein